MRKTIALLALLVALSPVLMGQSTAGRDGKHQYWTGTAPTSATNIVTNTVYLIHASFSTGGSGGTITLSDRSGACASGADCAFANGVAIAANTTYEMDFNSAVALNGLRLTATGVVSTHIHYSSEAVD